MLLRELLPLLGRHGAAVPMCKTRPVWPASQNIPADWPRLAEAGRGWSRPAKRLGADLSWIWRWRGVLEGGLAEGSWAAVLHGAAVLEVRLVADEHDGHVRVGVL